MPVFEAHGAGHLRFAVTTITIAEVLTGPLKRRLMTRSYGVTVQSSNRGSRLRSTPISRKALHDYERRSASDLPTLFRLRPRWRSTQPPS